MKNLIENRFLHLELQKQNGLLEQQVRDRTAQLEETLRQLQSAQESVVRQERLSALGMMASGIAHDFNNALTMVLGYSELLLPYLQQDAPPKERGYLHHVISAAQDATQVVSRLREFYRPAGINEIRVAARVPRRLGALLDGPGPGRGGQSEPEFRRTFRLHPVPGRHAPGAARGG